MKVILSVVKLGTLKIVMSIFIDRKYKCKYGVAMQSVLLKHQGYLIKI